MKQHRRHSSSYRHAETSLSALLIKTLLWGILVAGVGGLTWVAIAPLDAPSQDVVRTVPNDRLGNS